MTVSSTPWYGSWSTKPSALQPGSYAAATITSRIGTLLPCQPAENPSRRRASRAVIVATTTAATTAACIAARTIVEADGLCSRDRLEPYAARLQARYADAPISSALGRIVPDRVKIALGGLLLEAPSFVRHVVLDRWFLHRHQPALGS